MLNSEVNNQEESDKESITNYQPKTPIKQVSQAQARNKSSSFMRSSRPITNKSSFRPSTDPDMYQTEKY